MRQDNLSTAEHVASAETIRAAGSPRDIELARTLFVEYAQWLKVDLCFQGFDRELASLPGAYAPPRGRLLLAGGPDAALGCVALRPLDHGHSVAAPGTEVAMGEVKRLYVKPLRRGEGWGQHLAHAIVDEARVIGYRELKLDTLEWMSAARMLYASLGFRECAPYYENPLAGVVYMSLAL